MAKFDINPGRTALLIVDMQNCFAADSPVAAPLGRDVAGRLNRLAAACRQAAFQSSGPGTWCGPTAAMSGSSANLFPRLLPRSSTKTRRLLRCTRSWK
jgi:nicotinamidase-related amidase